MTRDAAGDEDGAAELNREELERQQWDPTAGICDVDAILVQENQGRDAAGSTCNLAAR